ncbi:MAG: cell division protein ZapA [Candidatus Latescibacteria bacterium]|nr:cell division protein ZapA [Candidatus Latescibacterota bacterium]
MSSQVVVKIFDKHYTLGVDEDHSAEHVQKLAEMVDERMHEVKRELQSGNPLQVAILASLSLVEELLSLREDYASAEADIAQRTSQLATSLGHLFAEVEVPRSDS